MRAILALACAAALAACGTERSGGLSDAGAPAGGASGDAGPAAAPDAARRPPEQDADARPAEPDAARRPPEPDAAPQPPSPDAAPRPSPDAAATARPDAASPAAASPCPTDGTPCRVMPLGDSITEGGGSPTDGRYRIPLFRRSLRGDKLLTFVGSKLKGPATVDGRPFPRQHEGHSGYTIDPGGGRQGISPLVPEAIRAHSPHVVILMIGTNDVNLQLDLANAPARLAALMDKIHEADPKVLLVVAQIIPTTNAINARVRAFNAAIPPLVEERARAGRRIAVVDMYAPFAANPSFKTAYMADTLHPNEAGDAIIADVWYAAIQGVLR